MFIALTGLHAAGKSYLSNNIMSKYGFNVCSKKDLVRYICREQTDREDWAEWYREEFNKDADKMTKLILSYLNLDEGIVLDAVHSDLEWKIIKSVIPDAELISVITPDFVRSKRREEGDIDKDKKRIGYWHNGGGCLLAESSWTLNGAASLEINEKSFKEFLNYIRNKQLSIQGETIEFSDNKIEKLQSLIKEDEMLGKKIDYADKLLEKFNKSKSEIREEETHEQLYR